MSWADQWRELNRAVWDERVPIHVAGEFYDVSGFLAGETRLLPFELGALGPVEGLNLVHPQCHFGLDTLSWAGRGAHVTGLDFSGPAIEAAREIAGRARIEAEFVKGDVYEASDVLGGRRFDVVYTGRGALNWLPDIEQWAGVMSSLVAPGGRFYLSEFHPLTEVFADQELTVERSYFKRGPWLWDEPGTYADPDAETTHNRTVEWVHGIGDVVTALAGAGLVIEFLREHEYTLTPRWPFLERDEDGLLRMPEGRPALPLMYSILASRR